MFPKTEKTIHNTQKLSDACARDTLSGTWLAAAYLHSGNKTLQNMPQGLITQIYSSSTFSNSSKRQGVHAGVPPLSRIVVRSQHVSKALSPISGLRGIVISSIPLPEKLQLPICFTLSGISMLLRYQHSQNAHLSIVFRVEGSSMLSIPLYQKHISPRYSTPSRNSTCLSSLH